MIYVYALWKLYENFQWKYFSILDIDEEKKRKKRKQHEKQICSALMQQISLYANTLHFYCGKWEKSLIKKKKNKLQRG